MDGIGYVSPCHRRKLLSTTEVTTWTPPVRVMDLPNVDLWVDFSSEKSPQGYTQCSKKKTSMISFKMGDLYNYGRLYKYVWGLYPLKLEISKQCILIYTYMILHCNSRHKDKLCQSLVRFVSKISSRFIHFIHHFSKDKNPWVTDFIMVAWGLNLVCQDMVMFSHPQKRVVLKP